MNRFEQPRIPTEARIRYMDGDYQVKSPGNFVKCAITGKTIMLEELKYWSVSRQELMWTRTLPSKPMRTTGKRLKPSPFQAHVSDARAERLGLRSSFPLPEHSSDLPAVRWTALRGH